MDLVEKRCKPCEGGTPPLSKEEAKKLHKEIPKWKLEEKRISRHFEFKNFSEAMNFVNKVADIAEEECHHPDIKIFYNKVDIDLWTHAVNGLSENDFIVAAKIDELIVI